MWSKGCVDQLLGQGRARAVRRATQVPILGQRQEGDGGVGSQMSETETS